MERSELGTHLILTCFPVCTRIHLILQVPIAGESNKQFSEGQNARHCSAKNSVKLFLGLSMWINSVSQGLSGQHLSARVCCSCYQPWYDQKPAIRRLMEKLTKRAQIQTDQIVRQLLQTRSNILSFYLMSSGADTMKCTIIKIFTFWKIYTFTKYKSIVYYNS